jgi:HK97 family phage portal protein
MDLLSRLLGRKQSTKQVNRSIFAYLMNKSAPDMKGSEFLEAYKGWVYACVTAIAEEVADIDLVLQQRTRDGWVDYKAGNALADMAIDPLNRVNPLMSTDELWLSTQSFLELSGETFWYVPPGQRVRKPNEIWVLDPTRITVVKSDREIVAGYVYRNEASKDIPLRREEVIHFKRFNPRNRYRGMGTVEAAAFSIDIDTYSDQYNRNFFYNSATPAAVLETDQGLTQEQYTRLQQAWDAKYGGVDNAHKTAILEGGLKFKAAGLSQKDMEFLEQKRWTRDEILGIFRVPRTVLGITDDVNRANAEATDYVFAKRVVKPRMAFIASRLTEFYLPLFDLSPLDWKFSFTDPVPQNTETDLAIKEASLAKLPWKTVNEIRETEGLDPIPDGDTLYVPGTFKTLDQVINPPEPVLPAGGAAPKTPAKTVTKDADPDPVAIRITFVTTQIKQRTREYLKLLKDREALLVKRLISAEGEKSIKTLRSHKEFEETERQNELVRFLFADWNDWIGVLLDPTRGALEASLTEAGKSALRQLDLDVTFDLLNPNVLDWLSSNALRHATSISDTIKDQVAIRIMEGVEQGLGAEDIAGNIGEFFDEQSSWRALRMARSEVISGYAEGTLFGYRQSGIVKSKKWLTAGDDRVDPECLLNEAQGAIPLESPFASGHNAPIVHPNCRCVIQPGVE